MARLRFELCTPALEQLLYLLLLQDRHHHVEGYEPVSVSRRAISAAPPVLAAPPPSSSSATPFKTVTTAETPPTPPPKPFRALVPEPQQLQQLQQQQQKGQNFLQPPVTKDHHNTEGKNYALFIQVEFQVTGRLLSSSIGLPQNYYNLNYYHPVIYFFRD